MPSIGLRVARGGEEDAEMVAPLFPKWPYSILSFHATDVGAGADLPDLKDFSDRAEIGEGNEPEIALTPED